MTTPQPERTGRRLRHLFKADPATLNVHGVRCVHCGGRQYELGHLGWVEEIKYRGRFRGVWNGRAWVEPEVLTRESAAGA